MNKKKRIGFLQERAKITILDMDGRKIYNAKGSIAQVLEDANKKFGTSGFNKLYDNVDAFGNKLKSKFSRRKR